MAGVRHYVTPLKACQIIVSNKKIVRDRRSISAFKIPTGTVAVEALGGPAWLATICGGSGVFELSTGHYTVGADYDGVADIWRQFRRGGGRVLPGSVRRRSAEKELFLGDY